MPPVTDFTTQIRISEKHEELVYEFLEDHGKPPEWMIYKKDTTPPMFIVPHENVPRGDVAVLRFICDGELLRFARIGVDTMVPNFGVSRLCTTAIEITLTNKAPEESYRFCFDLQRRDTPQDQWTDRGKPDPIITNDPQERP